MRIVVPSRWLGILVLAACGARGEPGPGTPPAAETSVAPPQIADSLILITHGGVSIWLAEGRRSSDSAGRECLERTLEIRRDTTRIKVPLLYTITPPTLLDDSTLRAELARNCRPAEVYHVDLRTGHPVPLKGSKP